jgi:DNA-binding XRE family transcriptional regulator
MKIFISWSGERSGRVATALATWLPKVIQAVRPWLSSASIDPGTRWNEEVTQALEELQCGVLCLTPENLSAPWILFEAGALSKAVSVSRVIPYLLGFEPRELQGPLAQFQAVRADETGTLRLVSAINTAGGSTFLSPEVLGEAFQVWWPQLAQEIAELAASSLPNTPVPQRSVESMMGEVLELLRAQRLPTGEPDVQRNWISGTAGGGEGFGDLIRHLRRQRIFTQQELAERIQISQAHLSQIESGKVIPSFAVLKKLAAALGIDISILFNSALSGPRNQDDSGPEPAT